MSDTISTTRTAVADSGTRTATATATATAAATAAKTATAAATRTAASTMTGTIAGATAVANATALASGGGSPTSPRAQAAKPGFEMKAGQTMAIQGKKYTVEKLIGHGGEAEVYQVSGTDGAKYALKLYLSEHEFDDKLIGRLKSLGDKAAVVGIIRYGRLKNSSGATRGFMLMEWCPDGSTADWDFKGNADAILQIVTLTARNLNELHKAGILHKDTKPENLLFTDKQNCTLLLSDFGISEVLNEYGFTESVPVARTPVYAAPELYDEKNRINVPGEKTQTAKLLPAYDYFALGMTALALWTGVGPFMRREAELARLKIDGLIEVPASMPEPLRTIVRGLLLKDPESRWGFDEIQRKLSGEDVPVGEAPGALHIVFDSGKNKIAHDVRELARFMMEDQQLGISYLYRGRICDWLRKTMPELEIKLNDIIETRFPRDQVAGLYAAALLLDPGLPCYDRKGATHEYLVRLSESEPEFGGSNLSKRSNPVYLYVEARQGKDAADALHAKVSKAASDKFGYPGEVLGWSLYETDTLCHSFLGAKTSDDKYYTRVNCHNIKEVLQFFSDNPWVRDADKKFVCSLGFVEMVRTFSPDDAKKIEGIRSQVSDYQALFRLIIQTLNPAADINLCSDPGNPWYAMTGESLGKFINMAFNAYYVQFEGDSHKLFDKWGDADNPYRNICQASLVNLIITSFQGRWGDSYLRSFFLAKGSRFSAQEKWASYCTSYSSTDNKKKYGPYDTPIAIMKTVAGFGFTPEYRFRGSSETVTDLAGLEKLHASHKEGRNWKDEVSQAVRSRRLYAWLAVRYQEDPHADLKPKYAYEELTRKYVEALGKYDPGNREYSRYIQARDSVKGKEGRHPILWLGLLQNIFIAAGCLLMLLNIAIMALAVISQPLLDTTAKSTGFLVYGPIVFALLLNLYFSGDRIWGIISSLIVYAVAMTVLYFLSRWFLWRFTGIIVLVIICLFAWYYFRRLLRRNEGARELRTGRRPDYEQMLLEPLHFAFKSSESSFTSSFGANDWYHKDEYKESLVEKIRPTILCIVTSVILFFASGVGVSIGGTPAKMDEKFPAAHKLIHDYDAVGAAADEAGGEEAAEAGDAAAETPAEGDEDTGAKNGGGTSKAGTTARAGAAAAAGAAVSESGASAAETPAAEAGPRSGDTDPASGSAPAEPARQQETDAAGKPAWASEDVLMSRPAMSAALSAADGIRLDYDDSQVIDGSGVFQFSLTNGSGADMVPFIVIEEPSASIVSRAEAIDDKGRSYSAADGRMSVTIGGSTMDARHRDPVFRFTSGQTVSGSVRISGLDSEASSLEIRIPLRDFDPDAYPYRRGYIIIRNIPVSQ